MARILADFLNFIVIVVLNVMQMTQIKRIFD